MKLVCTFIAIALLSFGSWAQDEFVYGNSWVKFPASATSSDLIDGTHPDRRWDFHSLGSGQFSDWIDSSNSVHLVMGASSQQLTNSTTTGVWAPGIHNHCLTNASPNTLSGTYSLAMVLKPYVTGGDETLWTDTANQNDTFIDGLKVLRLQANNGSATSQADMAMTNRYLLAWSVSSGTCTVYTNSVSRGTFTGPSSFQMNQVFDDVNNDPYEGTCTLILQWNSKAVSATDVSNIWYEVNTQNLY